MKGIPKIFAGVILLALVLPLFSNVSSAVPTLEVDMRGPTRALEANEDVEGFQITVEAIATESYRLSAVYLKYDGSWHPKAAMPRDRECNEAHCEWTWTITEDTPGTYTYEAKARLTSGLESPADPITVTITDSLQHDIDAPATVRPHTAFTIDVRATDNIGVRGITLNDLDTGVSYPHGCRGETCAIRVDFTLGKAARATPYDFNVVITDTVGSQTFGAAVLVTDNQAPVANLKATPTTGYTDLFVEFDGSGSYDPDASDRIMEYEWDFGDGRRDLTLNPLTTHTYENGGTYIATLLVRDRYWATDTDSVTIIVNERTTDIVPIRPGGHAGNNNYVSPGVGLPGDSNGAMSASLIPSQTSISLNTGEKESIWIKSLNMGEGTGEFEIEVEGASFGSVDVSPDRFTLAPGKDMKSYLHLKASDNAEGSYTLKVNLLYNGEVIDTQNIRVVVEKDTDFVLIGTVALLIIALAGIGGLCYLIYGEMKRKKGGQLKLEKYY